MFEITVEIPSSYVQAALVQVEEWRGEITAGKQQNDLLFREVGEIMEVKDRDRIEVGGVGNYVESCKYFVR